MGSAKKKPAKKKAAKKAKKAKKKAAKKPKKKKKKKKAKKVKKKKKKKKKAKKVRFVGGKRAKGQHKSKAVIAAGKKNALKQKAAGKGIFKVRTCSAALAAITGKAKMTTGQIVKAVWVYIKAKKLQQAYHHAGRRSWQGDRREDDHVQDEQGSLQAREVSAQSCGRCQRRFRFSATRRGHRQRAFACQGKDRLSSVLTALGTTQPSGERNGPLQVR